MVWKNPLPLVLKPDKLIPQNIYLHILPVSDLIPHDGKSTVIRFELTLDTVICYKYYTEDLPIHGLPHLTSPTAVLE